MNDTFLLDVNVLVALAWPAHQFHKRVQSWFVASAAKNWATCPFTQAGFVRVVSNPGFSPGDVRPADALRALDMSVKHPGHNFWPDDLNVSDALRGLRLVGHQQVTDAYLLTLAIHNKGKLATFDKSIRVLATPGSRESSHLELLSS